MKMKKSLLVSLGVFVIALAVVLSLGSSPAVGDERMTSLTQTELAEWFGGSVDTYCDTAVCVGTDTFCGDYHSKCTSDSGSCGLALVWFPGKVCGAANPNLTCSEPSSLCTNMMPCNCVAVGTCMASWPIPNPYPQCG